LAPYDSFYDEKFEIHSLILISGKCTKI
jgi:hypothetical protein